jgi:hypothetical protein
MLIGDAQGMLSVTDAGFWCAQRDRLQAVLLVDRGPALWWIPGPLDDAAAGVGVLRP